MPEKIIAFYCFFDDLLKAIGHRDDSQCRLTTAEVMTIAAVAAELFVGNQQLALAFLISHGYIAPFSKSRFNRRLHQVPETLWQFALYVLWQAQSPEPDAPQTFLVDTFPVPVCRNCRISRCHIYQDEAFRGYCASKKEYFYGLKVCLVVTEDGQPVEMLLAPGSTADITALRSMNLNLPQGSEIFADGGFLDTTFEADLAQQADLRLVAPRRKNMQEQLDGCLEYIRKTLRRQVETTFSQIVERLSRSVHAVTPQGFETKIMLSILTYAIVG